MTHSKIRCPECKDYFDSYKNKCECGWINKTLNNSFSEEMIRCSNLICEKKVFKNLNRVNEKEYVCEYHWEEVILKNQTNPDFQIQAQIILLSRNFEREAKNLEISNYEYFKKNCPGWGGIKAKFISLAEKNLEKDEIDIGLSPRHAHLVLSSSAKKLMKSLDDQFFGKSGDVDDFLKSKETSPIF